MTREKAIEILKEIIDEGWLISDFEKCTAIDACEMAIKALEQEPVKKLEKQIKQLQNRCHALTHGQICVFCPYECEHKAESEEQEDEANN